MYKTIKNYFEYFPGGPHEMALGFHVSSSGRTVIRPGQEYPPVRHPDHHHFNWSTGRTLQALQLVYVPSGKGRVEWAHDAREIRAGDCFLAMPGVWHRYQPAPRSGWTEHWVELRGPKVEEWLDNGTIDPDQYLMHLGSSHGLAGLFAKLHQFSLEKPAGYAPVLAGLGFGILSEASRHSISQVPGARTHSRLASQVRRCLRDPREKPVNLSDMARKLGASYPTLLRHFQRETGLKPKEYFERIRMSRAKSLLAAGQLQIKEIAAALNFHSAFHFSVRFKKYSGCSPSAWRASAKEAGGTVRQQNQSSSR